MPPHIKQQMLWTLGFLCVTYLPVQIIALVKCRRVRRILVALPLPLMGVVIAGAADPKSYEDGSLFGLAYLFIYLPSLLWLGAVCALPRQQICCPHCGHQNRAKSFRIARRQRRCDQCGGDISAPGADA